MPADVAAEQAELDRADGQGVEQEVPHQDWIELCREKRRLESGEGRLEIVVDQEPKWAGIDSRNLLIDRVPDDNRKSIKMTAG